MCFKGVGNTGKQRPPGAIHQTGENFLLTHFLLYLSMEIDFFIPEELAGQRLDQALVSLSPGWSRSRAASIVSRGKICVDGMIKRPGYRVKRGDHVSGTVSESREPAAALPEPMDLPVLFEDEYILLVNKPPGLVVHPGPGNYSGTLVNGLLSHAPDIRRVGQDPLRPGIVHRLDKDTSGLILTAKTTRSLEFLQKEFQQRRVKKEYLALVSGKDLPDSGEIDLPIGRHPVRRKLMAVNHETGKPARTSWRVAHRFDTACLVEVRLHTGRTHQIRVHFYALDHPLVGDRVYQYKRFRKKNLAAERQMLHSWKLGFRHPYSGRRMEFQAPVPPDFKSVMDRLRQT
ncbi:RluA family pseudouridine synthase [Desulfospira joergensenii]|uniref:RluA family pseudouridine synthase n=1 Tax=Desulfospira joergensenii TaxID=53329 RepID=UPI0003B5B105|nr:RluA family pseudouridine synthase [Desulfospira joergensenii]